MIDYQSEPGSWARAIPSLPLMREPMPTVDVLTFEPSPARDRWWAERWLKSASPGERQAMRELLAQ